MENIELINENVNEETTDLVPTVEPDEEETTDNSGYTAADYVGAGLAIVGGIVIAKKVGTGLYKGCKWLLKTAREAYHKVKTTDSDQTGPQLVDDDSDPSDPPEDDE